MLYNPTYTKLEDGAYIIVTHKCNRQCPFCIDGYRNSMAPELTPETLGKIIPTLIESGIKRVTVVGGEPFMSPFIEDILSMLHKQFDVVVSTNSDFPEKMKNVSAFVDHWNFSLYGDKEPPFLPRELNGDITLSKLIHAKSLSSKAKLDSYIDKYQSQGYAIKFSTLDYANLWCRKNGSVPFLDSLGPISTVFNDVVYGQWYRGFFIDRKDIHPNYEKQSKPSLKVKPNGDISFTWSEELNEGLYLL